jgi:hypothetical protein
LVEMMARPGKAHAMSKGFEVVHRQAFALTGLIAAE